MSKAPPREDRTHTEHLDQLRVETERLARTYPTREAHMAQLRSGLERMAQNINARRYKSVATFWAHDEG